MNWDGVPDDCLAPCPGDVTADGEVDLSDPLAALFFTTLGRDEPPCLKAADINNDGVAADISDAIHALSFLFLGTVTIDSPFPGCGLEPVESGLSCNSFPPCADEDFCGSSDEDWLDLGEARDPEDPSFLVFSPAVLVYEDVQADVINLDVGAPGTIEWGDGTVTPVDEDGTFFHNFRNPGEYTARLVDRHGGSFGETVIHVIPELSVEDAFIFSGTPGFPLKSNKTTKGIPFGSQSQVGPCFGQLLFDLQQIQQMQPGQMIPFADPIIFQQWSQNLRQCNLITQGQQANDFNVTVVTNGIGTLSVRVVATDEQGNRQVIQEVTQAVDDRNPIVNVPVPAVGTHAPGTVRLSVEISDGSGNKLHRNLAASVFVYAAPAACCDPCEWIILLHALMSALKEMKKDECQNIMDQIAQAETDMAAAQAELDALSEQMAACTAALGQMLSEKADKKTLIEAALGKHGQLVDGTAPPEGMNFVGAHGVGVAFGDAQGLLDHSAANDNLLGQISDLATLTNEINKKSDKIAQDGAKAQGLESKITDLGDKIDDLLAQLAACMAECAAMEADLATLEADHEECLLILSLIRKSKSALDDLRDELDDTNGDGTKADDAIDGAEDEVDGSAGSDSEKEPDYEKIQAAKDKKEAALAKLDEAEAKYLAAEAALSTGDFDGARALIDEAKALETEARECLKEAIEIANEAQESAEARGPRACEEGTKTTTTRCYVRYHNALGTRMTPHGFTPEGWDAYLEEHKSRAQAVIDFLNFFDWLSDEFGDYIPIGGTVTPDAERAINALVDAYAGLIDNSIGADLYVLLEGNEYTETTCKECINGRWVITTSTEKGKAVKGYVRVNKANDFYVPQGGQGEENRMARDLDNFLNNNKNRDYPCN